MVHEVKITPTAKERVEAGKRLLDEYRPDWRERVDICLFDMGSQRNNLLSQVFGSFEAARLALDPEKKLRFGHLGFWRIKWIYRHPGSDFAQKHEEKEDEIWAEVCNLWFEIVAEHQRCGTCSGEITV